jgi:hypothetical protein
MIELAIAILWFLLGVVILGFVVWVALYVLHQVFSNLPGKFDQAVWGIFALLCLIYALTLLAGGGHIAFPRVG